MINTFLGKKIGQTQIFDTEGMKIPVTEISVEPSVVVQIKTLKTDGYWALQLGFGSRQIKKITKPEQGHLKKTGQGNFLPRFLKEVKLDIKQIENETLPFKIGDKIEIGDKLKIGDIVRVTGIAKSKGFQGGVKRHGFAGGSRTHGQSDRERAPGSIGSTTTPGRVYKGKRMAGRMGGTQISVSGLKIAGFDKEKNILQVKGSVPGSKNSLVIINK